MKTRVFVGVDIKCRFCGKIFTVPNCQTFTAKYCSRECKNKGQLKRFTKPCYSCGKPISRMLRYRSKRWFCTTECLNKWQKSLESPLAVGWTDKQRIQDSVERLMQWRREHPHPFLGKHHSDEVKMKIATSRSRKPRPDAIAKYKQNAKQARKQLINLALEKLGGVCQLCKAKDDLQFAHIFYPNKRKGRRGYYASARDALKFEGSVLLLCKECHNHPEKYLKELIDLRKG